MNDSLDHSAFETPRRPRRPGWTADAPAPSVAVVVEGAGRTAARAAGAQALAGGPVHALQRCRAGGWDGWRTDARDWPQLRSAHPTAVEPPPLCHPWQPLSMKCLGFGECERLKAP